MSEYVSGAVARAVFQGDGTVMLRRRAQEGEERNFTQVAAWPSSPGDLWCSTEWHHFSLGMMSVSVRQVTNQVTRDSSTGLLKPALGRSWSFVPSTRVLLESKGAPWEEVTTRRSASLAKSPRQVRLLPGQHLCDGEVTRTWPQSRGRFLMGLGRFRPHGGTQCSGRGTHAAWLRATEEKSTCSLQLELVFIGKLNERHCLQSRSPCSSCSSRSRDAAEPAWTPAEVTLA